MSKIQVNEIVNHFDTGAPDCPKGLTVTGVATFSGGIGGPLSIPSGNVGIGTDNPITKLNVHSGNTNLAAQIVSDDAEVFLAFKDGNSTGNQQVQIGGVGNTCVVYAGGNERVRIGDLGNTGIGVVNPEDFHVKARNLVLANGGDDVGITLDCNTNKEGSIYFADGSTGDNLRRGQIVYNHDGDTLRFVTNANERMRIDGSQGRVGINTTSFADTATALNIKNGVSGSDHTFFDIECDNNETCGIRFSENGSTYPGIIRYFHSDNSMRFYRNSTEHMRMDGSIRTFHSDASARFTVKNANTSSGSSAFDISNGASNVTDGTQVFSVRENGDIYTAGNTSIQALSSERRLKENIELIDRSVSWATIKNTPYYTYNLIGQEGPRYGPIVDEVPAEMVKETDLSDDQGPIRTFDNGMLNARLYVALQEAIAKIETLETKVAALEGN